MKSERDREKTDGGTGGRTGRQAGRKKKNVLGKHNRRVETTAGAVNVNTDL